MMAAVGSLDRIQRALPPLMSRFMSQEKLPNFQKLYDEGQVYVTQAEEEAPYLEPWIQWSLSTRG